MHVNEKDKTKYRQNCRIMIDGCEFIPIVIEHFCTIFAINMLIHAVFIGICLKSKRNEDNDKKQTNMLVFFRTSECLYTPPWLDLQYITGVGSDFNMCIFISNNWSWPLKYIFQDFTLILLRVFSLQRQTKVCNSGDEAVIHKKLKII